MFADNFLLLINNPLAIGIILIFLNISSYTDIKYLKIYDKSTLAFLIIRIILIFIPQYNLPFTLIHLLGGIFGLLILLIPAMIVLTPMGGDIRLITILGLYLGFPAMLALLFILCASCLIYVGITKSIFIIKKKINNKTQEINTTTTIIIDSNENINTIKIKEKLAKGMFPLAPFFTLSFVVLIMFASTILNLF